LGIIIFRMFRNACSQRLQLLVDSFSSESSELGGQMTMHASFHLQFPSMILSVIIDVEY